VGVISIGSAIPEGAALELPSVARGDSYTWRATQEFTFLFELLASVEWDELDLLLFDLPPGAERTAQYAEALGAETAFVLVTVPSALSQGVVGRSLAALEIAGVQPLGWVENMSGYYCPQCREVQPLFPEGSGAALPLRCLGRVPFDPELAALCDRGELERFDPERPAARAVEEVFLSIEGSWS
jgi:ATP-binding protein involved in chromosome partitioning